METVAGTYETRFADSPSGIATKQMGAALRDGPLTRDDLEAAVSGVSRSRFFDTLNLLLRMDLIVKDPATGKFLLNDITPV
jgi:hypothetical protein